MRIIVIVRPHEGRQMGVTPHQGKGFARRDVKVAGDFVQIQSSVDTASVVRFIRLGTPKIETIHKRPLRFLI